jgi:hypothetical protein
MYSTELTGTGSRGCRLLKVVIIVVAVVVCNISVTRNESPKSANCSYLDYSEIVERSLNYRPGLTAD